MRYRNPQERANLQANVFLALAVVGMMIWLSVS
jgi:hypothetical protein